MLVRVAQKPPPSSKGREIISVISIILSQPEVLAVQFRRSKLRSNHFRKKKQLLGQHQVWIELLSFCRCIKSCHFPSNNRVVVKIMKIDRNSFFPCIPGLKLRLNTTNSCFPLATFAMKSGSASKREITLVLSSPLFQMCRWKTLMQSRFVILSREARPSNRKWL